MKSLIDRFNRYYLQQRFFPNWLSLFINPFFFIRAELKKAVERFAVELNGNLLDYGCGSKPYQILFTKVDSYVGVDLENEGHDHSTEEIDFFYDGKTLPFADETFDSLFSSEVLEHVPDIDQSLKEIRRVLKPRGRVLITVPFVWTEHELPFDFRRFTQGGIEKIMSDHGFEVLQSQKAGSFVGVIFQMIMMYLHTLLYTSNKYLNLVINAFLIAPVAIVGLFFNLILPKRYNWYFNTIILASKK